MTRSVFPLVTAVITTRSRPQYVHAALASVHAETYPNVECLVVDDGGTFDLSGGAADRNVSVLHCDGVGVAGARNAGLNAARGEFIIFLDDDDVALPDRISTLASAAERESADVSFGMTRRVIPGSSAKLPCVPTHLPTHGSARFCDVLACNPHVNAVLARTSMLRAAGGFDAGSSHFDDWSAWLRLADRNARMCSVPDIVAEWRIHDAGLSSQVIQLRAMKARIFALFDRLSADLSPENARAISIARGVVASTDVNTYDDYANAMHAARQLLHDDGQGLGTRRMSHEPAYASARRAVS